VVGKITLFHCYSGLLFKKIFIVENSEKVEKESGVLKTVKKLRRSPEYRRT
jgi:hypothetical protein